MAASDNEVDCSWDKKLPMVILAYSTNVHESTKSIPFSLMYGREVYAYPSISCLVPLDAPSSVHQELTSNLEKAYNNIHEHLQADQYRQKDIYMYDRRVSGPSYACGDKSLATLSCCTKRAIQKVTPSVARALYCHLGAQ